MNGGAHIIRLMEAMSEPDAHAIDSIQIRLKVQRGQAKILHVLFRAGAAFTTQDELIFACCLSDPNSRVMEVQVNKLRKRFGNTFIINVRLQGYRLSPEGLALVGAAIGQVPA